MQWLRDGDAMGLTYAIDETMAELLKPLAPHKSAFDISGYRQISTNISIPKPVIATISSALSRKTTEVPGNAMDEFAV